MSKQSFEQWMSDVDKILVSRLGIGSMDLPDVCYRDWYDDDITPAVASSRAINYADGAEMDELDEMDE